MSWFAAISLPQFPLQAALRLREEAWYEAVAVLDGNSQKGRVLERTNAAAQSGVFLGMVATQALARCPALQLLSRSQTREEAMAALLVETAFAFSSFVEATSENLCLLDLRQVNAADWEQWARAVVARCAQVKLRAQVGLASNPDLATLAAQRAEPVLVVQHPAAFLAGVAIAEVDAPPELLAVLRDWGIGHLGELAKLPRQEITRRLGSSADELWERAAGRASRELRYARLAEIFFETFDFEQPIDTTEPLLFILRRQLDQLTLRLGEALRVAARLTLTIPLDAGATHERSFTIPSPTRDAEVLFRILATHLENLRLEQQPIGVRLLIEPVIAESSQHRFFDTTLRDPNRFGETLGRLAALVGAENVGVIELADTHRPDSFRLVAPRLEDGESEAPPTTEIDRVIGLPLGRFRPPLPAQVRLDRELPTHISFRQANAHIVEAAGPYRLSGAWWDRESWITEEWDVALGDGALYRLSKRSGAWFVEGCYQERNSSFQLSESATGRSARSSNDLEGLPP